MFKSPKYRYLSLFVTLLILLFVSACSNNNDTASDKKESENKERVVQDANGDVTIPAKLTKIVAPYSEDALLTLGVTPAYQWAIGDSVIQYLQPQLKDVPKIEWNLPIEQVVNANPDLLIFSSPSAVPDGDIEKYKKVTTPFVLTEEDNKDWRKALTSVAKIVDKEDIATEKLAEYDKKAAEAKTAIHDAIGDETVAILWVIGDAYYLVEQDRHSGNVVYGDLGIKAPEFVASLPAAEASWNAISLEKIAELDADHIILVGKETETGLKTLQASSVWKGLPAVKAGNVHQMKDPSNWTITGYIANEKTIDETVEALTK
ncbi:ABC transporter substrate-binding protein [Niallia sp. NCCP-28]|uniref:ABC transporter substrate-binding protein n=1 Tax=Niallia sp. NCCP-28 TaxID=2934712 RepID=UPI002088FE74|nr:ABC transporter substrate-binding protein [Niallia sp. NCCP-28]GKU84543.1 ferrichrome ABC transporter substrate-binding protein [Niallia sp. NCCP-28]